jgi:AraC family transcriptional regulator, arabinose operon regulatory protein
MTLVRESAPYFSAQVTQTRRFYHAQWRRQATDDARLNVVGGGCEWCAPDFRMERDTFPYVAMEFVCAGRGRVRLGKREHALSAGVMFFFDPGVPHAIVADASEPMVKYFFNFAGVRVTDLLKGLKLGAGDVMRVAEPARLTELLEEAIDHALKGTRTGLRASSAALEYALTLSAESRQPTNAPHDPAFETYLRCRNYLLRQYPVITSISDAAQACHVSGEYFTRLFQRYDRETPHACLNRLKLHEALQKLRTRGVQAKAVAAELGFKSAAHFSRAFKEFHGFPPRDAWHGREADDRRRYHG